MANPPTAPVPTIDATGLHVPDFTDVLAYFKTGYQSIYGSDVYLENDSQDGQLISLFALAVDDMNSAIEAAYNSYSPSTAQGAGLSSVVKINGITRHVPTNSSVDLYLVGVAGTTITNGFATGADSNQWILPSSVSIGSTGDVTVTSTASEPGDLRADPGTITGIGTPTLGWQTVTNLTAATPGAPLETDAALRPRQTKSTMLPSQTVLDGIQGELLALSGVQRVRCYENDTDAPVTYSPPSTPFPPHSISCVIDGGTDTDIANTIAIKKTPGAYTNGTTAISWTSPYGIPETIRFSRPRIVNITYMVSLNAKAGFTTIIQQRIAQSLADWTNGLLIGETLEWIESLVPAQLYLNEPDSDTYEITSLTVGVVGGTLAQNDIIMAFDQAAACATTDINFSVVPAPMAAARMTTPMRRRPTTRR